MPPWPSMLSQAQPTYQPVFPQPLPSIQPVQPISIGPAQTPVSATSSRSTSTPRKTLTDSDRKRMCQWAEDHPNSKQTEIGVDSTVSKVLRQKEKYLLQDDGSRSPIKRAKGRSPDIERALANWAKNQIRDTARAFAATTTTPENNVPLSASWIEKFKLRNNLMGARSRKASLAPDDGDIAAMSQSFGHSSPPTPPASIPRAEQILLEQRIHRTRAFVVLPRSPEPDIAILHLRRRDDAFSVCPRHERAPDPPSNDRRERAPTAEPDVPLTGPVHDSHGGAHAQIRQPLGAGLSPMEEQSDPLMNISEALNAEQLHSRPATVMPAETMRPPPLPAHVLQNESARRDATASTSPVVNTTPEEARRALQVVLSFFEQQPAGFLDLQESLTMGKLLEKLNIQSRGST
ncbi:hypothetical protein MRB53_038395 [Persea americana]|nr:hypothetical protein MRB53_038395 [Persea americana]